MERDRKTEIVTEYVMESLKKMQEDYGMEIGVDLNADYQKGRIWIRVNKY